MGDHGGIIQIEYDDISMKTKLILTRFGLTLGTLRVDEKSSFNTLLEFPPFLVFKPTNAIHVDSSGVYTSQKILYLSALNKNHLKCDLIDSSLVNGIREPLRSVLFQVNHHAKRSLASLRKNTINN